MSDVEADMPDEGATLLSVITSMVDPLPPLDDFSLAAEAELVRLLDYVRKEGVQGYEECRSKLLKFCSQYFDDKQKGLMVRCAREAKVVCEKLRSDRLMKGAEADTNRRVRHLPIALLDALPGKKVPREYQLEVFKGSGDRSLRYV
jgi:hypothetical protein